MARQGLYVVSSCLALCVRERFRAHIMKVQILNPAPFYQPTPGTVPAADAIRPTIPRTEEPQRANTAPETPRQFITALGGALEIVAPFPEGAVRITQFAMKPRLETLQVTRSDHHRSGRWGR